MSTFTPEEWARRRNFITASQVPAIFNLDTFQTAGDVQAMMLQTLKQGDGNDATDFGHIFGPALCDWVEHEKNVKLPLREHWVEAPNGVMACTLDGANQAKPTIAAEAKASRFANDTAMHWGDDDDSIPIRVIYQVVAQMVCCPALDIVYVPALVKSKRGAPIYEIRRNEDFCNELEQHVLTWHQDHIVDRKPVPDTQAPSMETMKRVAREEGKTIEIADDAFWQDILTAKQTFKDAEENWDRLRAIMANKMGDATIAIFPSGSCSFKTENGGMRIDTDALKKDHPDVYMDVAHPTTRQIMRFSFKK